MDSTYRNLALLCLCLCAGYALVVQGVAAEKEIPATNLVAAPKMTFLYCYSCGYRKAFEDYANLVIEKYPYVEIDGANYDPPGMNYILSKLIFALKIIIIVSVIGSFSPFTFLGMNTPTWWNHLQTNKIYACMMIFFLGNMIESQLISSGAFEITLNDVPVWSKLQTGRIPAPQELMQIIDNQLQFSNKVQENPDFVK
ncbi:thioredoxin reductase-like selenoprotein T homolog CG3887 [Scaptodrosophila lebanonensis]|uniref:Thioredoxin reductase-like selenoprotein T homolog CG3887 n=1 Tax=Drosophila lebanonensis TaxID=7225 RepID=A0A6J2U4R5_DROLE|nr:thioredoxin reductase-like selenoprotein T homolog CG3887 [Scaptodrosophila lebanonensis]